MNQKSQPNPKKPTTFRLDASLKEKLNELAKSQNKTPSKLINLSVKQFLDRGGVEFPPLGEERKIGEITLLLQVQRFNKIGFQEYVNELKTFAKEFNISDENIYKIFTEVTEYAWKTSENKK